MERLQEAEYFLVRLPMTVGLEFQANLNAFLSASRSVTFLLQSSLARVPGFDDWYGLRRQEMSADPLMLLPRPPEHLAETGTRFIRRFGTTRRVRRRAVPCALGLSGRDIAECCAEHVTKLARLLPGYFVDFLFMRVPSAPSAKKEWQSFGTRC
ncbi:hypothetical protein [Mesorhizobium sp. B2-4-17]|uniref:hypothetical protein n=1 Tax=Mesorhizobium sp. B2-4-17 TaxID=2589932 RepID=UPI001125F6D4|nr:hypothetical protein [Mesorhizobium sp. B2-4-17]TPK78213.1 hypothetical protein FJ548_25100 [Mesorhizobium sp. B2-4-17]